ncbi:endopeptidase La [Anaplasmataceae bacterium AB001_6]|nr:endopeptidase La [Anaplasmataceae bacterium AB001_6]
MSLESAENSNLYYTIPLREVIFFPGDSVPLLVGRKRSVEAIELASKADMKVVLVTQKNADIDDPNDDDLYKYGVTASIAHLINSPPEGSLKILVQCEKIVKITKFVKSDSCLKSQIEEVTIDLGDNQEKNDNTISLLKDKIREYFSLLPKSKNQKKELLQQIDLCKDVDEVCNAITSKLDFTISEKQSVLEVCSIDEKVKVLYNLLFSVISILKLEHDLKGKIHSQIEQAQKNYYLNEQMKVISKEISELEGTDVCDVRSLSDSIKKLKLDKHSETKLLSEINKLKIISAVSAESSVIRSYIDFVISLPWNKFTKNKIELKEAAKILNENHHGMYTVKERILEFIAVHKRLKNNSLGSVLCLVGPPGVGKTSLAESIAESLGRKFASMSLGGLKDESELRGHRRTYIGAMPGRIIQMIKRTNSSNPLILLDEVDKISGSYRSDPSFALIDILDSVQNHNFTDNYLEVPFDISKVMFVLTANDISEIPYPLLDRMEIISIDGYTSEEKLQIVKKQLLKRVMKLHGLLNSELSISDSVIGKLINNYTTESGVRDLKRQLEKICRKALVAITESKKKKVIVTEANMHKFVGFVKYDNSNKPASATVGVSIGLAYTNRGGCILPIEAIKTAGEGKLTFTGHLGDVMKESMEAGYKYVFANADNFTINSDFYKNFDVHVHVPEGAVPKDGPSAGIAIVTAIISVLSGKKVSNNIAMTGEINLRGEVMPIGGLKEKILAAIRENVENVIIPLKNMKDIDNLPKETQRDLRKINIIPVSGISEVLKHSLIDEREMVVIPKTKGVAITNPLLA